MKEELTDLRERFERLNLLYQVGSVIHSTLDPEQALQLIVKEAVRLMRGCSGSLVLVSPTTGYLEILASTGLPPNAPNLKLRVGEGITGSVARTGKPVRSGDVSRDRRYIMARPDVRSELAVPLQVNGEVRGVLNVDSEKSDAFTEEDQELLEGLAQQAVTVIQNTWLYEQLRLKARLFESLAGVSQVINSALNLDDALQLITREAGLLMRAKVCSLLLLDESGRFLDLRASYGAGETYLHKPRLEVDECAVGAVVRRKKPLQIENVQVSGRYTQVEIARREGLFGMLSVPLLFTNRSVGVLNIYTAQPYVFSNEEIRILSALAQLSAIAIEKARLYERAVDVEEQLRQNEKLSALGLLAAEVAHEIRNPLTVMMMLYHSLDLKFPEGDPRAKDARMIGDKMEHLNRIVEQVLDFARTTEPRMGPVSLNEIIDELGLLVRHKLKNQNVRLTRNLLPDLPSVQGHATQLEQAFLNLVLNAAEAMPTGGELTITTRLKLPHQSRPGPAHLEIEFADTGCGMTQEQRRDAFTSVLGTSKEKGTGIGLAIVRRIVESHHGRVKIKSAPGQGTTVSISLPLGKPR